MPQPWMPQENGNHGQVIDCHCHAGKGNGLTGPWDTSAPLEEYLLRASAAGIDRTVVFPPLSHDYAAGNLAIVRMIEQRPDRLLGFAFVHPQGDRGRVARIVENAAANGLVGLKVHRQDGRITREICDAAAAFRLPILYDVMGETQIVELLAQEYPRVNFIIPHLGSFADDWKSQRNLIDMLARHPNVFTDSAGVRRFDLLVETIQRAGPSKLLFGSDGPWLHPGVELYKLRQLKLAPDAERLVLGGNLARLVNLDGRPRSDRRLMRGQSEIPRVAF